MILVYSSGASVAGEGNKGYIEPRGGYMAPLAPEYDIYRQF